MVLVDVVGIDQPKAILHDGRPNGRIVVLKVPGHNYWSGRGQQSYAPTEFQVYERNQDTSIATWYRLVTTFPARKRANG